MIHITHTRNPQQIFQKGNDKLSKQYVKCKFVNNEVFFSQIKKLGIMSKYNYSSPFQSVPAYSFPKFNKKGSNFNTPGPGAYNYQKKDQGIGIKFD